jgi:hypothetical protein
MKLCTLFWLLDYSINYPDKRIVFNGNRINDRVLFFVTPDTFSEMMAALFRTTGSCKSELSNQMI